MALRRFSDNPAATLPLDGTEIIPALQGGVDVQVAVQDIVNAAAGAVTSVNGETGAVVLDLGDLGDVDAASPSDGDVLTWVAADSEWQPAPASSGGGIESIVPGTGISVDDTDPANPVVSATGGGGGDTAYTIITEASAFTADPGTHDGLFRYIRAGGNVTFDDAEPYTAGMAFNIRATGAIELLEDGVTLTPPSGGTLELSAGMSVQVVMTSVTTGDVIGQTVAA